jgi:hypothetical protein
LEAAEALIMKRLITAAALGAALWGIKRWLDQPYVRAPQVTHHPTESWENEGGALAPRSEPAEATQVPR